MGGKFLDQLCSSWRQEVLQKSGGWGDPLHLGSDSAAEHLLTHQVWLLPHPQPSEVLGDAPSSSMCTNPPSWSCCSSPAAQRHMFLWDPWLEGRAWLCHLSLWGEYGPGWRRSWGQQMQLRAVQTHRDGLLGHCLTPKHSMNKAWDAILNPLVSLCHLQTNGTNNT